MNNSTAKLCSRRQFLATSSSIAASMLAGQSAWSASMPKVESPRATSGDFKHEPSWDKRLTLSVGPNKADIVGSNDKVIQAAVDYVVRLGGGTVKVLPGKYSMRNSIFLRKGVRLLGSGQESILFKEPSIETTLAADSDWFDQEVTLENRRGFKVGDGVILETKNPHHGGLDVLSRTLVARSGNRFKLDRPLRKNFWQSSKPTVSTRFSLITAENESDFVIENIALDGNRANNTNINGNYAGGLWFQDCNNISMSKLDVREYNGDAISFQICHDVSVVNCEVHNNTDLGIHPGSGSQRPRMTNNHVSGCSMGIFFCWGVKYGLAHKNLLSANTYGVSIGHHDDENIISNNDIIDSKTNGVVFRPERGEGFTAKGNRVVDNVILNSGGDSGIAVDIQGVTSNNSLIRNLITEKRGPSKRIGIRMGAEVGEMELVDNVIDGFATALQDLRKA